MTTQHPQGRREWAGKTGKALPPANTPAVESCSVDACGTPAVSRRPPMVAMVRVVGAADGADAHWYCPGRCAAIARARADLRAVTPGPGGVQ